MVIIHIYGARSFSLLFCDHQDTESESCEMEMSIPQPIFTHKIIKGYMGQRFLYSTRWVKIIVVFLHVYGPLAIFLLICDHQDTESESYRMEIFVAEPIITQKKA